MINLRLPAIVMCTELLTKYLLEASRGNRLPLLMTDLTLFSLAKRPRVNEVWFVAGGLHNRELLDERFLRNGTNPFCGKEA